ncbi:MAG: beta-ketoacyl synthase N-terminal-like domain-containing protein, partial [Planctomycetota bacterium]
MPPVQPQSAETLPAEPRTLHEVLQQRAAAHGDRRLLTFLGDGERVSEACDYRTLDLRARQIAGWLQAGGYHGEPVALVLPEGVDFVAAFFGCLYAGAIATPASPPRRSERRSRLAGILASSGARCVLTNDTALARTRQAIAATPALSACRWQSVDAIGAGQAEAWSPAQPPEPDADAEAGRSPAFLQYTSGSTGDPKGVVVTHANLMENQRLIARAFGQDERIVVGGWLPVYHDMGLIGNILHPLYLGGQLVFMPPVAFLQKPIRWLRLIADYGATIAGGPDFAYDLCVRETTPEQRAQLDLSRWEVAFNGSEPIHAATLDRFAQAFAGSGFRRTAFCPCFGMAETTLLVSGSTKHDEPCRVRVDAEALTRGAFTPSADGMPLVGSGKPDQSIRLAIVDPETRRPVEPGKIGEVWLRGETVARGYWRRPELSQEAFNAKLAAGSGAGDAAAADDAGPFFRTGDLGTLHAGELFITGRRKDLIIIRGANHYPQDIERTSSTAHEAVADCPAVALAIDFSGRESLAIVQEVRRDWVRRLGKSKTEDADSAEPRQVIDAIRQAVAEQHALTAARIVLVRTGSLPRTSSGKLQRQLTKTQLLAGDLKAIAECTDARRVAAADAASSVAAPPPVPTPALDGQQRRAIAELRDWIVGRMAARCGASPREIDADEPFARYGLDSLAAVRLSGELSERLGRPIAPTLAFDYPTPAAVAEFLIAGDHAGGSPAAALNATPAATRPADEPLAVVGLGCRLPGADTPGGYWRLLRDGVCSLGPAPVNRWPEGGATSASQATRGGYLPAVDQFDPAFFAISPREAEQMDPQQRLLLEVAWETLEDAGANPDRLRKKPVGVFVGVSSADYPRLQAEQNAAATPYSAIGGSLAIIANRLSFTLDLRGPSLAIDTACSSSLVAVHQAAAAIRRGECDAALAGGVNLIVSPSPTESLAGAGMLSPTGRSLAFCRGGDGFVRGEGCGLVLLRRLGDALAAGDRVYGVLR